MTTTNLFTRDGQPYAGATTTDAKGRIGYYPGWRVCPRCGGAGGADKWAHTGWKCFECQNANHRKVEGRLVSVVPSERFIPVYTATRLASLDKAAATREANRQRKAAEAAKAEAERVERERAEVLADHADILPGLRKWGVDADDRFLADLFGQVHERARALSAGQRKAAEKVIARLEAEDARRAAAAHVGTVGERVTLDLTYVRHVDLTDSYFGAPTFMIWVFRTADGNTVVFKGGKPKAFDALERETVGEGRDAFRRIVKGATIRLKATVKAHEVNRKTGEPETIIQRPAAG